MQAHSIDARVVLTILALGFALIVAATPRTTMAVDEPDEFTTCRTGGYVTYLECIEANIENAGGRGIASADRPAILHGTLDDYLFMDQNRWGEDFVFAPTTAPYLPSPYRDSIFDSSITSY